MLPITLTVSLARRKQELQHGRDALRPGNLVVVASFDFAVAKVFAEFPPFLNQSCLQSAGIRSETGTAAWARRAATRQPRRGGLLRLRCSKGLRRVSTLS